MTVAELRKALEGLPDDMPVFLIHPDSGWLNEIKSTGVSIHNASDCPHWLTYLIEGHQQYVEISSIS